MSSETGQTAADADLVTVVIPARNEERFIESCVDSVLAQDERNLQVIVVDGASTDRTADLVKELSTQDNRLELLHNPDAIIPKSLNLALAQARGRWLVRIDAHATVPPDYVSRAVAHLRTGKWGGAGGRKDGVGITPAGKAIAAAMASPFGVGNSTYHYGTAPQVVDHVPFGAYPTDLVRRLGGWDEALAVNQDFEFDWRLRQAGHEILFHPELRIDWHCRQSVPDLFRQYRRYGSGKVKVAEKHPASVRLRHLAAPGLVLWLTAAGIASIRRPRVAVAAVAPYVTAVAVASGATSRHVDRGSRRWLPAAFAAMHVGWGIGFWTGVLRLVGGMIRR